jgi:hypothetical protein
MPRLTWSTIRAAYAPDLAQHLARAADLGLECPPDVFEQLFHDHHGDADFGQILRFVDWGEVEWEEGELSGVALRQVAVPRPYRFAVDEARRRTAEQGFSDERPEVMEQWAAQHTWIRAPIALTGEVLRSHLAYELIVGFTRLGNLLGALDRRELPESSRHRIWIGRPA